MPINKYKMKLNLDTELSLRPLVLRNLRTRSVFRIQEGICRAFHEHLQGQGFTEIHTPKIVHAGQKAAATSSGWNTLTRRPFWPSPPSSINR